MRTAVMGMLLAAALLMAAAGTWVSSDTAYAQRAGSNHVGDSQGLITYSTPLGDARQQLTVIDPQLHVLSIYHIESTTGEIALKSVRNIHWDLQMSEFNGKSPLPREIRSMLDQK